MSLVIELSPEMEKRLHDLAARAGQPASEFARRVLEHRLASGILLPDGLPPDPAEELIALAARQGVRPVSDYRDLVGDWSDDTGEDDTDVDSFLALLDEMKREDLAAAERRLPE